MNILARLSILAAAVALALSGYGSAGLAQSDGLGSPAQDARVRIITNTFVLPAKLHNFSRIAAQGGVALDHRYVDRGTASADDLIANFDLLVLDTPRPMDLAMVEERVGSALRGSRAPWIRIGGGPPAFGNLAPEHTRRLIGYYAAGGADNLQAFAAYVLAWRTGRDVNAIAAPRPLPAAGIYHSAAPRAFATFDEYRRWGEGRWRESAPRVAFAIHSGLISAMETHVVDALVARSEARGLVPVVFWFEAADPDAVTKMLAPAGVDAIVIATHLQNGPARLAEFLKLDVPVLQAVSYRDGTPEAWLKAQSGINPRMVAPFLALPESWGVSDPLVIDAVRDGEPTPIPQQVDALLNKAARLAALRHKPAHEKRFAVMFWNYPPGEKNLSASNLNVPRSLENVTTALAAAGYDVPATPEQRFIDDGQALLGGLYHPEKLDALLAQDLAEPFPVSRYRAWLATLPAARRDELLARWGDPAMHSSVREIGGEKHFVIPRLRVGKLVVLPQPPRGGTPGQDYHDSKQVPAHAYLATYLHVREVFGADALIHLGTHGTQEWTPGKDRGLAVSDYPFLAVGDLPVLYPYIQDNVAEAVQAKRRGRAVIVSHQTPPFAPAGLYDELHDLHEKVHEYAQLEDGGVRETTAEHIRKAVLASNMHRDMGWDEAGIAKDFPAFLTALHDHVHELARHAMPLGLHTFGEAASPEHRLTTVMQQLGDTFYRRAGNEPDEFFATDFKALSTSPPYSILARHLRDGEPIAGIADPELRAMIEKAAALDQHLAQPGETEALLAALAGKFVRPGPGGDPIRNPDVPSGRNLYPFEPDKLPTRAAYEAGAQAFEQLIAAYKAENGDRFPQKIAFSLWAGEAMRHLGLVESQVLHALGLKPVWNDAGRLIRLDVIPASELGRPRVDAVLQVTSVYRDQFDGFMRLLGGAIEKLAALDEPDNPIARNTRAVADQLETRGLEPARAQRLASLRIFSNAPGDYGTNLPDRVLKSTSWEKEDQLAEAFLDRLQYAYGSAEWGADIPGANLFASQLRGVEAAVLSRSSKLHGVLSTDHPFEYLGGLSLAVRHLDGKSPKLFIADLRDQTSRVVSAGRFLADELRARTLNPHWIAGMQKEGYAGTLEILNAVNNVWGWQVTDPTTIRADQWQSLHDTFVRDVRKLGVAVWFERHNPTAQGQLIERMIEAIRKGYWEASEETRLELVQRWQELADKHAVAVGEPATRAFIAHVQAGAGLDAPSAAVTQAPAAPGPQKADNSTAEQQVRGPVLEPVSAAQSDQPPAWQVWAAVLIVLLCLAAGAVAQIIGNARLKSTELRA